MKLIWVQLNGFKKFREKSKMNLDSKVIAILGKNEAGKTSFLEGLEHLNSKEKFIENGIDQELTRGQEFKGDAEIIEAGFRLENSDIQLLEEINEGEKIRFFIVYKQANGKFLYDVTPIPKRNLQPRITLQHQLESSQDALSLFFPEYRDDGEAKDQIPNLIKFLQTNDETISKEILDQFTIFKSQLEKLSIETENSITHDIIKDLEGFIATESANPPIDQVLDILAPRIPPILRFTDEDRDLKHSYSLTAEGITPKALQNLALLAGLDLSYVKQMVSIDDQASIETLIRTANLQLKRIFEKNWSQSNVHVHLRINADILHIQIDEIDMPFTSIAERSDGLRYYVALLAFVSQTISKDIKPILLIDEAETHLHYDAQADLVQMFAKQELASQIIYTSHSIGCLPEDLGAGVRIIEPSKTDPNRSIVRNWFWETNEPGFSPLLFGMGAQTLAFVPVRKALFAEGSADFILLPTLLREANNSSYLGFQVVPGLSIIKAENVPLINNEAARVAYLVDADDGGEAIAKKLRGAGVPEDRIMRLPKINSKSTVLEDLIVADVYAHAINQSLRSWHDKNIKIPEADFPKTGRPAFVDNWCENNGIAPLSRREIAYRILDEASTKEIVSPTVKNDLIELFNKITKALDIKE